MLVPVLALADRFRTSTRLGALVLVLLVPAVTVSFAYATVMDAQITRAQHELDGTSVLADALGLLATAADGEPVDVSGLAAQVAANPSLDLGEPLAGVRAAVSDAAAATPTGRVATATALVALISQLSTASELAVDPGLDAFPVAESLTTSLPKALLAAVQAEAGDPDVTLGDAVADQAALAGRLLDLSATMTAALEGATENASLPDFAGRLGTLRAAGAAGDALGQSLITGLTTPTAVDVGPFTADAAAAVVPATSLLATVLGERLDELSGDRSRDLVIALVGATMAVWLAAAVWWRTRTDVSMALSAVSAISHGDLEPHPLPSGSDEFGDIGIALDVARQTLLAQQEDLETAVREREHQAQENFVHQRLASQQARLHAQEVVADTSATVVTDLQGVVAQVSDVRRAAGTIDDKVQTAEAVTSSVVAQAGAADRLVDALSDSLQDIRRMALMIAGVADQTKLLALNATIEAARAGEAGRGFSVVANEVKELAAATAASTEEITGMVAAVEGHVDAVSQTITAMTAGISSIDEATDALRQVAAEQRAVVQDLDEAVSATIDRVAAMGDLATRLERRRSERFPAEAAVTAVLAGRRLPSRQLDLGEGGTRLLMPTDTAATIGAAVTVELNLEGRPVMLSGRVVRSQPTPRGQDVGVEFDDLTADAAEKLARTIDRLVEEFAAA